MNIFKHQLITKRYALKAALFRRLAKNSKQKNLSFTEQDLINLFNYETHGIGKIDERKNGFAYGKWIRDLSISMMIEDIQSGIFCKADFLDTVINKLHNNSILKMIMGKPFLKYEYTYKPLLKSNNQSSEPPLWVKNTNWVFNSKGEFILDKSLNS